MSREVILESNIINRKREIYLDVMQSQDYVLPNAKYTYQVYVKNISGLLIKNVRLFITKPGENIYIDGGGESKSLGDLKPGESIFLKFKARATKSGFFNVNFTCFGENTEITTKSVSISCGDVKKEKNTIHRIGFYNFDPYESSYRLSSRYYNEEVTQLIKVQSKPFINGKSYFKMSEKPIDYSMQAVAQQNEDNLPIGYIGRENYEFNDEELYYGSGIEELIKKINDNSELVNIDFIRSGNGILDNNLIELYPQAFINRFSLLTSEIYHRLGVFPSYSYMSDYLMRWSHDDEFLENIYPKISKYKWGEKFWPGESYSVWHLIKEDEKDIKKFELWVFDKKEDAQIYIKRLYEYDAYHGIEGHYYYYTRRYYENGVFYVNIPVKDIPSNFFFLDSDDLSPIVEKTKPYGLKGLLRYVITETFNHHHEFNPITRFKPQLIIEDNWNNKIIYCIRSKKYIVNDDGTISLIDMGKSAFNTNPFSHMPGFIPLKTKPTVVLKDHKNDIGDESFNISIEEKDSVKCAYVDKDYSDPNNVKDLLESNHNDSISYYKQIIESKEFSINQLEIPNDIEVLPTDGYTSYYRVKESNINRTSNFNISYNPDTKSYNCVNGTIIKQCDEITLIHGKDIHNDVEVGISLVGNNKDHVISFEPSSLYNSDIVKYEVYSGGGSDVISKNILDVKGISLKLYKTDKNKTLVVFYYINSYDYHGSTYYYKEYIKHDFISNLNGFFIYGRNTRSIGEKSIIHISKNTGEDGMLGGNNSKYSVVYDTPDHSESIDIDSYRVFEDKISNYEWNNPYRMNKDQQSYAYINGKENNQHVNTLTLYCDSINIPDDCVIEEIGLRTSIESSTKADMVAKFDFNNNYGCDNDYDFKKILEPNDIDIFEDGYYSIEYLEYMKKYSIENYEDDMFDYYFGLQKKAQAETISTGITLDNINVNKQYWINVDFKNKFNDIILKDVSSVEFEIKGYNSGPSVKMKSRLCSQTSITEPKSTYINPGYFNKKIRLFGNTECLVSELFVQYLFEGLNNNIEIFDMNLNISFDSKQKFIQEFTGETYISTASSDIVYTKMNKDKINFPVDGRLFKNGLTFELSFKDINKGDSIKIYSVELELLYRKTDSKLLIENIPSNLISVSGKMNDDYVSGLLFGNETSCEQLDYNDTYDDEPFRGFELEDGVYQSFIAHDDNITSIEIYPNGIVGNPSSQIEISVYNDINGVPGDIISQNIVDGWGNSFSDDELDATVMLPIYCEKIIPNEQHWFSIRLVDVKKDNYYLLKSTTHDREGYKMFQEIDNNLQNAHSTLAFKINSKDNKNYFITLPYICNNKKESYLSINLNKDNLELYGLRTKTFNIDQS